jgi:hypothetical protein
MGVEGDYLGMPLRIEALDQLWTLDETATSVRPFGDISRCLSTCTGRPLLRPNPLRGNDARKCMHGMPRLGLSLAL